MKKCIAFNYISNILYTICPLYTVIVVECVFEQKIFYFILKQPYLIRNQMNHDHDCVKRTLDLKTPNEQKRGRRRSYLDGESLFQVNEPVQGFSFYPTNSIQSVDSFGHRLMVR